MTPPRWALALLACAGGTLAACSSTPSTPKHVTTTTHTTAPTTSSTSTSTTASTTTTTTSVASTACTHITASAGQGQGAAGTITGVITVTNTGPSTCVANGYPTIALVLGQWSAPERHDGERSVHHPVTTGQRGTVPGRGGAVVHRAVRLPVLRRADRQ